MSMELDPQVQSNEYHLTFEQRLWIISQRLDGLDINMIIQKWPFDRRPPHVSAIYELIRKVKETGCIEDKPGRGGVVTMNTPQNRAAVVGYVEKYRHVSVREIAEELNFSKSFVQRVLVEENFRAYKIHQIPTLRDSDVEMRFSFAEWYLNLHPRTRSVIWWSDECWFRLESDIITQNYRVWSRSQPNETEDRPKNQNLVNFGLLFVEQEKLCGKKSLKE